MIRSTRLFAAAALLGAITICLLVYFGYQKIAVRNLILTVEQQHMTLSESLETVFRPKYSGFELDGVDSAEITTQLDSSFSQNTPYNIINLHIYDRDGGVLFATTLDVETAPLERAGYVAASAGTFVSYLYQQPLATDTMQHFLTSYIPLRNEVGVESVLEVTTDVTLFMQIAAQTQWQLLLGLGLLLLFAYAWLMLWTLKVERTTQRHESALAGRAAHISQLSFENQQTVRLATDNLIDPLTTVDLASSFLLDFDRVLSAQSRREKLQELRQSVHQMLTNVDGIVQTHEISAGALKLHRQTILLQDFLCQIVVEHELAAAAKSIRIDMHMPRAVIVAHADKVLLTRSLNQLLSNALKFSPPRSVVSVVLSEEDGDVSIAVKDNGKGWGSAERPHLFEKYSRLSRHHRSRESGNGVGLYLANAWIGAMGGSISAESPGQRLGSVFTITLPTSHSEAYKNVAI